MNKIQLSQEGSYRPNIEDVLEVNVKIGEPVSMNIQQSLTRELRDKTQLEVGIITVGGEVVSDTNIQVLIRNAFAFIKVNSINDAIEDTFTQDYEVQEVNLTISERLFIREKQRKPFLSRSSETINIIVPLSEVMELDKESIIQQMQRDERELAKSIDRDLPISVVDSGLIANIDEEDNITILGIEFNTDSSDITLKQLKQLQEKLFERGEFNFNVKEMTISASSRIQ